MVGIVSYSAYIPLLRLSREAIAKAWEGRPAMGGERSIANYDEDSVTMAVEAGGNCLRDRERIKGLFFASTTSPYKEKQCSTLISAALDLPKEIRTADFANSLRAGSSALISACDAAKNNSGDILMVASDCRLGFPQSDKEQSFGDAAAALVIGSSEVIASVEATYSIADEITDVWRADGDTFVQSWEERWVVSTGYTRNLRKAISEIMQQHNLTPKDFAKVVFPAPDPRSHRDLAQTLGFDLKTQLQDPLLGVVGDAGAAHPLLLLAAALDEAKPGDRILLAAYGQGSDALILRVTEEIGAVREPPLPKRGMVKDYLASKRMLPTYGKYLIYRQLIEQPAELFNVDTAATIIWRTRDWVYSLHGSKCRRCGMVSFPIQRVCYGCQSKDDFDEVRLSDKKGKVFTFSLDNLAGGPESPVVQAVVESEEGGARIYCLMTDCDPKEVKVGMPVEMTFRRLREARGFYNYFWKCRPLRVKREE